MVAEAGDDGVDAPLGFGLELELGDNLSQRGEVEWFDIENADELFFASLGVSFFF